MADARDEIFWYDDLLFVGEIDVLPFVLSVVMLHRFVYTASSLVVLRGNIPVHEQILIHYMIFLPFEVEQHACIFPVHI